VIARREQQIFMQSSCPVAILLTVFGFWPSPSLTAADPPPVRDTRGVLRGLSIARFSGTNQDSIQALASDSSGNTYVAGTTYSPQFPVKNAAQPSFGEARILRSTDLGTTWTRAGFPPNDVSAVVADPVMDSVLFAAGSNGIYKSADTGQNWQTVYPFPAGGYSIGASLVIDPGNHLRLAAVTPAAGGIIRSVDGGQTWTPGGATCGASSCGGQLFADPAGSGILVVTDGFISRDWGLTFQEYGPGGGGGPMAAAFDPSHPGWIYVGTGRGASGDLYLSTDYGVTWTPKASPPTVFSNIMYLVVDPDQPNILMAACANGLYKSSDGATSWTLQAGPMGPQVSPHFSADTGPSTATFALVHHSCNGGGGILAMGSAIAGISAVAFSSDFGLTWNTPQLSTVSSVASGPGCTLYVTRRSGSDAFVAKLGPDGDVLWATFLGGSDQDAIVALALDPQGNVYVAGNTSSPDFPGTVPHIGPVGEQSAFVAKLSPVGTVSYSVTIGGEAANKAVALAIDLNENAYLAGTTNSLRFPATPGTIVASLDQAGYAGFLAKLSSDATLAYATYLGQSYTPGAIVVDANEEAIVGGSGLVPGFTPPPGYPESVMKLDRGASQVISAAYLPTGGPSDGQSVTGMALDSQNNLLVYGQTEQGIFQATPGAYSSPQPALYCAIDLFDPAAYAGDAFVIKLRASDWQPVFGALLTAPCGISTGSVVLDSNDSAVLAMAGYSGLPLRSPMIGGPACNANSSAIAKLSADGSTLQFATYLDGCGVPGVAVVDGLVYAGVSPLQTGDATSVLRFQKPAASAVSIDQISNAFSGDATAVAGGGLYTLATSGFDAPSINLGIDPAADLPDQLNGVEVKFDGVPASVLSISPGQIMVAVPQGWPLPQNRLTGPAAGNASNATVFTSVQLFYNGVPSNTVSMPLSKSAPGLLTLDFPSPVYHDDYADANARNQDGTMNSAGNPAPAGSTLTLFTTGVGPTDPVVTAGSIAHSSAVSPVTPLFSSWETAGPGPGMAAVPETTSSVPGFVSAMFQVQVQVPANAQSLPGTELANGVRRVTVGLQLAVSPVAINIAISNYVAVYVK
jgi:uncharacterized protein (TIGR03437 family)